MNHLLKRPGSRLHPPDGPETWALLGEQGPKVSTVGLLKDATLPE